ncbi:MAG: riboflavin synthase [Acidobacteriia bacterium]|nr:riboflavin synthase [Terriglobia bacterium]
MFTGLIQETGRIAGIEQAPVRGGGSLTRINVIASSVPGELKKGDSVAVSGVCLTAVEIRGNGFSADLAQETVQRTSLGNLQQGSLVNLELPARAQDRMGGHVVQGHVDGVGRLIGLEKIRDREDWRLVVEIPQELARYVVPQGSITIEGISLTVAAIHAGKVEIAIIPHTYQATNLHALRVGDPLNVEVDVLAKYAEKMMRTSAGGKLTVAELIKQGF